MSTFESAVKYLKLSRARAMTASEAPDDTAAKYLSRGAPARQLKRIFRSIVLPAQLVDKTTVKLNYARILFQYNVSFSTDFYIYTVSGSCSGGFLCIKWREGTDVFRYVFASSIYVPFMHNLNGFKHYIPQYNNQAIPENVCIEFWSAFNNIDPVVGLPTDFTIHTSSLTEPESAEQLEDDTLAAAALLNEDIGFEVPITEFPVDQTNIVHLDN